MMTLSRRSLVLALMLAGLSSVTALALPGFSDMNVAAGNLNPTDRIAIQQIKVTGDSSDAVSITSVTVKNLGTAASGQINRIEFWDGGTKLGETTNIAGLAAGITVNFYSGYVVPKSAIRYINVFVVIGTSVTGGETVQFQEQFYYVRGASSYTSPKITDLTTETIRKGGFDQTADSSATTGYLNPDDQSEVQTATFTDNDANGSNVLWTQTGSITIVRVENLGTATTGDILQVKVTLTINGIPYDTSLIAWTPTSGVMGFGYNQFSPALPGFVPDDSGVTVKVEMKIQNSGAMTDGRTIRTKTTLLVKEGTAGNEQEYQQAVTGSVTQTLRKQGFEETTDQSTAVSSGTKATGENLEQVVKVRDVDINNAGVTINQIWIQNLGTAAGTEVTQIDIVVGGTTTSITNAAILSNLKTGITQTVPDSAVADDGSALVKIYYQIGTPVDGHTLRPTVKVRGRENATDYWSDAATYADGVQLFTPGFEVVENTTPPEGGTAYSGQRFLAQTIHVIDRDEKAFNVLINPVVVKNIGSATSTDITKIEIYMRHTEGGERLLMGSSTAMDGFRTAGVWVQTLQDNQVLDADPQAEAYVDIYLTVAEPEQMTGGRTVQLETRILHTEDQVGYDKMAPSNQWTLATNHRPVVDFTFAAAATASARPKADFTYEQTIQFTGSATDSDGDAISSWHWDFGDGNTSDLQNPTHRYPNGGTFNVTLTVTDARGVTGSKTKAITVQGPPNVVPTVDFTWTPTGPAKDQAVTFTATVTDSDQPPGTAHTYAWDFGDTSTSTAASPQHAFTANQSYTVKLTVTDAQAATATAEHVVVVGNAVPVIGTVTANPTSPATGDEVGFTAAATDADAGDTIASYAWSFGDGSTAVTTTTGAASHTYAAPGTYTVSVTATDSRGAVSAAKTLQVTVTGPAQVIVIGYPNPASTQATIGYYLPDGATNAVLRIYSLAGRLILEEELNEGDSTYVWTLRDTAGDRVANGLYFCVVTATGANGKTVRSEIFRLLVTR